MLTSVVTYSWLLYEAVISLVFSHCIMWLYIEYMSGKVKKNHASC